MFLDVICATCNEEFKKEKQRLNEGLKKGYINHYCSSKCRISDLNRKSVAGRADREKHFWSRVDKTPGQGPTGDCWIWTGTINSVHKYGYMNSAKIQYRAHRLSYELHFGKIPEDLVVMHECDNKVCVNPDHLKLGTIKENSEDAAKKGLYRSGSSNPSAVLNEEKVKEIKKLRGSLSSKQVAIMFGVSTTVILNI